MVELIPETYLAPLDPLAIFGRAAPLHVDLGCGDGSFLCELARQNPDKNFLGTEKLVGRVAKVCRKAAALENVRVLNVESSYAVRYLLPEASVETFYLLFPDPWPKRRHHRRRIVTHDFLNSIHQALESEGVLRVATDQRDYFAQIDRVATSHSEFGAIDFEDVDLPMTKFERRFREAGAPVYRLALRKVSPVTNAFARQPSESKDNSTAPVSS
ncbi:MAG TPA: tRNA (guanosine(46)-N7)-methyltransferase TrmB [Chthoniobacterales bacterium]|nr:tRNA (guanosine(46)-N7)-methyltransferase TrmB [Chthoniobacterales bacterium]